MSIKHVTTEDLKAIYAALDNIILLRDEATAEYVVDLATVGATGLYDARETVFEILFGGEPLEG